MLLQNMKIGTRLTAGFSVIGLLALAMGMLAFNKMSSIGVSWDEYENVHAVKQDLADYLLVRWETNILRVKKFVEKGEDYSERFLNDTNELAKTIATYREKGMLSPEEKELAASIASNTQIYLNIMKTLVEMRKKGADVTAMNKAAVGPEKPLFEGIKNLIAINKERAKGKSKEIKTLVESGERWIVSGLILITIIALAIILFITISITTPLIKAVKIAKRVASGDLTGHIEATSGDETGELLQALKTMNDGILCIAKEVRTSSNAITVAVKEIAVGNSDLSQRTEEQASSLEETASSMEELISTVRQNADNSKQANQLASSASSIAIKGGDIVGKVVVTMDLIDESSKKIVDIISVIEGIAFQTNILSLNAAVEAARAGEQGRGFAVVAGEVRILAQRSAAAAKEIKALIGDSVGKVSDGTKLVEEAGRTMDEIVGSVKKVGDIIAEIAAASEEQTSGIEQVNQAIVQMDEVTQQNAALVEEAAASAAALEEQATTLNMAISLFKLGGVEQTPPTGLHSNGAGAEPVGSKKRKLTAIRKPSSPATVRPVKAAGLNGDWREF